MSKISVMSEDLSNKIAAGEVVEKTMTVNAFGSRVIPYF